MISPAATAEFPDWSIPLTEQVYTPRVSTEVVPRTGSLFVSAIPKICPQTPGSLESAQPSVGVRVRYLPLDRVLVVAINSYLLPTTGRDSCIRFRQPQPLKLNGERGLKISVAHSMPTVTIRTTEPTNPTGSDNFTKVLNLRRNSFLNRGLKLCLIEHAVIPHRRIVRQALSNTRLRHIRDICTAKGITS